MPSRNLPAIFLLVAAACGDDVGSGLDAGSDAGRADSGPGYDAGPSDAGADAAPDAAPDAGMPGSTVTLVLESGPMTFPALTDTGAPLRLTAGFAADLEETGRASVYAADGATLRRLHADSLRFVEPLALTDPAGAPLAPPQLLGGVFGEAVIVAGLFGGDVRLLDLDTGRFSEPAPLLEVIDMMMGTTAPLAPRALELVLLGPGNAVPVALDPDGDLLLGDAALRFVQAIAGPATCHGGTPIDGDALVAGTMPDVGGPLADTVLLIEGENAYPLAATFCFEEPIPLVAEGDRPVAPDLAFAGDLDGDGEDELVLVEEP